MKIVEMKKRLKQNKFTHDYVFTGRKKIKGLNLLNQRVSCIIENYSCSLCQNETFKFRGKAI